MLLVFRNILVMWCVNFERQGHSKTNVMWSYNNPGVFSEWGPFSSFDTAPLIIFRSIIPTSSKFLTWLSCSSKPFITTLFKPKTPSNPMPSSLADSPSNLSRSGLSTPLRLHFSWTVPVSLSPLDISRFSSLALNISAAVCDWSSCRVSMQSRIWLRSMRISSLVKYPFSIRGLRHCAIQWRRYPFASQVPWPELHRSQSSVIRVINNMVLVSGTAGRQWGAILPIKALSRAGSSAQVVRVYHPEYHWDSGNKENPHTFGSNPVLPSCLYLT